MSERYVVRSGEIHFDVPQDWPEDDDARADAERRALDAARFAAHVRMDPEAWALVPEAVRGSLSAMVQGLEAHWPLATMRPPAVNAAIRAFREGGE